MQTKSTFAPAFKTAVILLLAFQLTGCKKGIISEEMRQPQTIDLSSASKNKSSGEAQYNLEVVLRGDGNRGGHIHFRQERDPAKIITLDTKVHRLLPNHAYSLQRAVDTNLDGQCTGTSWLTLGYGLTPHNILTDNKGNGSDVLWRDVSAISSGTVFDIHFRVIDALTGEVVLSSDCYQYTVR
jgi:hypothetical protein